LWSRPVTNLIIIRNQSIFWEPGGFGFHLIVGSILALKMKNKFALWIIVLTGLTTMSTTVYVFLCLLYIYQFYNSQNKLRFIAISLVGLIIMLTTIRLIFGNLDLPLFLVKVITEKIISTGASYGSFEERALYTITALQLFVENIIFGAGHYSSAILDVDASQTSGLAGILADLGLFGMICILLYIVFFREYKLFAIPIVLIWLNGEYLHYSPLALFILAHVVDDLSYNMFPSMQFSNDSKKGFTPDIGGII
jgi:hypothetical protein